jgi:hypothetical protein
MKYYAIVGDFNWRTDLRYDHRSQCAYIRGRNRLYIDRQTNNRGGILNLIFSKGNFVDDPRVTRAYVSDHRALFFNLRFGKY